MNQANLSEAVVAAGSGVSAVSSAPVVIGAGGIDSLLNDTLAPFASWLSEMVFYEVSIGGVEFPLIVAWLIAGASYFTVYFRGVNIRGMWDGLALLRPSADKRDQPGEISHFQALATALSGTVGVGNIAHVAVAISIGGPGAIFWLIVAGLLGMASKFVECTLGVKYRIQHPDGSVSGGPMFYLHRGLAERGWPRLGRGLAIYYAICISVGCLGAGSMFQSNQAYVQFLGVTGGDASFVAGRGWSFGLVLALLVGVVTLGGIKSIARVAGRLVPFMALLYAAAALFVIAANFQRIPEAVRLIVTGAFAPEGVAGGAVAVMILGFRRAAFSNEAGIGSAAIAHSAVRTTEPITQGLVALLEPFIDTVVVCTLTGLVITLTVYEPALGSSGISGVELTSSAFASVISWFPYVLAVVVMLFAYSTMIAWSYYGLEGCIYLFGPGRATHVVFNLVFCASVALGAATQLKAILDFSDALIFAMALANILGLYMLAPVVRLEYERYRSRVRR
ncbi:MAG: alanine/glycine:cation symporter family protein [Myxococcota bacterium]|jgi:AGCS family alanine or glycine:cation symporter|nr:alanine glycine permease [Deltaproteobacteria bacterium]MCP4239568.1 alanine:cation symporter family protein [bacterium]MDP6075343.1 alanine/glycine:cation symporter family protein [Myxococcota bacterium]MDP6242951.1 alanine/glycine:cation symporter family protein [Myxococcota bacterium]MDP7073981.1 alanine/glycine:cation symporter family protein [Myxococcota bacterium]